MPVMRKLRRAFLATCRCGDVTFSPYRLTTEQYALMRVVQCNPGIRQMDLTDRIIAEPNTVTAMVSLLERRDILRRKPCPSDGRVRLLYLTAHGHAMMTRLADDWEPLRAVLRRCFSGRAGEEALEILDTVYVEMTRERQHLLGKAPIDRMIERDRDECGQEDQPDLPHAGQSMPKHVAPQRRSRKSAKAHAQVGLKA